MKLSFHGSDVETNYESLELKALNNSEKKTFCDDIYSYKKNKVTTIGDEILKNFDE